MIVEKALKMTQMMDVPVLGVVENMSYALCPDCGTKISVFGESHLDELARRYGVTLTARLPIDPKLAAGSDKGMLELFNGDWLDALADAVHDLQPRKHV